MTTFAKRSFDAASYLRYRPTYSQSLISHVLRYAEPKKGALALDLGCGPGQATILLSASGAFSEVIGMDPSRGMIEAAETALKGDLAPLLGERSAAEAIARVKETSIKYQQGSAEDLSRFESNSFDLVTAGQAAHWFKHDIVYNELARVVKPGGTVAYWGYAFMFIPDAPAASQQILSLGTETLGAYWEPGRAGCDSLYDLVPFPAGPEWQADSFVRCKFDETNSKAYAQSGDDLPAPPKTTHHPIVMDKKMFKTDLVNSLKTWSSVHNYMEKHTEQEHIIDSFYRKIENLLPPYEPFTVQWPVGMLLMKKKSTSRTS